MRQRDFIVPLALLGAITVFFVIQVRETRKHQPGRTAAAQQATAVAPQGTAADSAATTAFSEPSGDVIVRESRTRAPVVDTSYVRELLRDGSQGTYLRDLLAQQDNLLMRWPDRQTAMRVWIERDVQIAGWDPRYPAVAGRAFEEWQEAGFPLRFDIVLDPREVDIRIKWIERFPEADRKIGMAAKVRDQHGWLVSSEVSIATHDPRGQPLPPEVVAGTTRHEIGHALGLGHSGTASDVMYPESRTPVISASDRKTLRLLYMLPPGRMP